MLLVLPQQKRNAQHQHDQHSRTDPVAVDQIAAQPTVNQRAERAAEEHGKRKFPRLQPGAAGGNGDKAVRDERQEAEPVFR